MSTSVAIVGGGLAGLAAAAALVERGLRVELFEARKKLGGRAGSYVERATGELIDHCQHVAMGCCTNYLDFCRRTGTLGLLARHDRLHFFAPDGHRSDFSPSRWLPPPLHLAGSLLGLKYLSLADKWAISGSMLRLLRLEDAHETDRQTVLAWLRQERQSPAAIERFWQVVLVSALGESLDRASLAAARKVFVDGFLAHRDAAAMYAPTVSLGELYDRRVADWLGQRGAALHLETPVEAIKGNVERVSGIGLNDGSDRDFDFVVLAVPWRRSGELLPPAVAAVVDPQSHFGSLESAPISSVHLWFDRSITELPHAVLVGRLSQWVFARTLKDSNEHYYQVVISASHELAGRDRQAVLDEVLADLRAVFPAAAGVQLVRSRLITEHEAVFSVRPGHAAVRPRQQTAIPNLLLAGDWTATGWPATMEGAVRSGYLAAEAILVQLGRSERILVPDLPRGRLVRLIQSHPT
jgi:squalene-associated FAD-dependent desaturase